MRTLWLTAALGVAAMLCGCGESAPAGSGGLGGGAATGTTGGEKPGKPAGEMTLTDYLDLKTDALTADKIDWQKAMEIARKRLLSEPDAAKTYNANMPVQWFNAEHDVYIFTYRRLEDRDIAKGAPKWGYAVILNATTGKVKVAGAYQR
jgi:hypothetical protein